jgi:hypothetical protein
VPFTEIGAGSSPSNPKRLPGVEGALIDCPKTPISNRYDKSAIMLWEGIRGRHMIRDVKDLSPDQKMAVESLLGRSVLEQETVSVQAFQPPAISDQGRQEIVGALRQYFAEVDAKRQPVSDREAGDIIDEAMRNTRPGYRPHQ